MTLEIREFATWDIDKILQIRKWVPLENYERLQQEMSLAEEGLANYQQENEQLRATLKRILNHSLEWALICDHDCLACDAMYDVIRDGSSPEYK